MLSSDTSRTVRATVPLLTRHGEAITRHFYRLLFERHPELAGYFNDAHQASGTQAKALAGAVLAYAMHLDDLAPLASTIERIVHKHVALGVEPAHYPLVGGCLLQAIADVLGEAADDDVLAAWGEAYGALAAAFIDAEARLYRQQAEAPGGWRGERAFRVARRVEENELIASFYLEPLDGAPLRAFLPGQFITVLADADGARLRRNYSLSDAPGRPWYRISVKREPGGRMSNWLHDRVNVGDTVHLRAPAGEFVLDDGDEPLLLITGGVGITPAMSMLEVAAPTGRAIRFVHAARHGGVHAFRERVDALAAAHPNVTTVYAYDEPRAQDRPHMIGRLTREALDSLLPQDRRARVYLLGPLGFMRAIHRDCLALGLAPERLRYEFFGPPEALQAA